MFDQILFNIYSFKKKANCIAESGELLGVRDRNGRKIYLIMVKSFFVEALYLNDNPNSELESFSVIGKIGVFKSYMEKSLRASI